jgi:hypothetical protein
MRGKDGTYSNVVVKAEDDYHEPDDLGRHEKATMGVKAEPSWVDSNGNNWLGQEDDKGCSEDGETHQRSDSGSNGEHDHASLGYSRDADDEESALNFSYVTGSSHLY